MNSIVLEDASGISRRFRAGELLLHHHGVTGCWTSPPSPLDSLRIFNWDAGCNHDRFQGASFKVEEIQAFTRSHYHACCETEQQPLDLHRTVEISSCMSRGERVAQGTTLTQAFAVKCTVSVVYSLQNSLEFCWCSNSFSRFFCLLFKFPGGGVRQPSACCACQHAVDCHQAFFCCVS